MNIKKEDLLNSMVDTIYILTAQPLTYNKLNDFFGYCGQQLKLEETCYQLGYKSFNHCIRENEDIFGRFLEIYAAKKDDSSLMLYYQNADIKRRGKAMDNLNDKSIEEGHVKINFGDAVYFEAHNDPQFIQGRKKFAQAVNFCQENPSPSGLIRMHDLQASFPVLFGEEYNKDLMKAWFPQSGKMDSILQNILFEEIEFEYENPEIKQGIIFRLCDGLSIDEIYQKLDDLDRKVKPWFEKIKRQIADIYSRKRTTTNRSPSYRPQSRHPPPTNNYFKPVAQRKPPAKSTVFADSDSEEDNRVENRAYNGKIVPRKNSNTSNDAGVGGNVVVVDKDNEESPKIREKKNKESNFFVEEYTVADDVDLYEYFDETIKEAEEMQKIINLGGAGNSKAANALKVKTNPAAVVKKVDIPSRACNNSILNPVHYFNDDVAYTDEESDNDTDAEAAQKVINYGGAGNYKAADAAKEKTSPAETENEAFKPPPSIDSHVFNPIHSAYDDLTFTDDETENDSDEEEMHKVVNLGGAGNSEVDDATKAKTISATVNNEAVKPSRAPNDHVLNPGHHFNANEAYTDDEANDDNNPQNLSHASNISPSPTSAAAETKNEINSIIKSNEKLLVDGLLNTLNMSKPNSLKTNDKTGNVKERKPSPSVNPGSSITQNTVPKPPKKFEFLNGFTRSSEMSKAKKEAFRREREEANQTNLKKSKQMVRQLPIAGAKAPMATAKTSYADVASSSRPYATGPQAASNVPPTTSYVHPTPLRRTPEHAAVNKQFATTPKPNEIITVRREPGRPYNYASKQNNHDISRQTPTGSGQTQYGKSVEPLPQKSPPVRLPYAGNFRRPHNLPKPVNPIPAAAEHGPDGRQNSLDTQSENVYLPEIQQPIPRRVSPPVEPPQHIYACEAPPVPPHAPPPYLNQIPENYDEDEAVHRRQFLPNSFHLKGNIRHQTQHDYHVYPPTVQQRANDHNDNHRQEYYDDSYPSQPRNTVVNGFNAQNYENENRQNLINENGAYRSLNPHIGYHEYPPLPQQEIHPQDLRYDAQRQSTSRPNDFNYNAHPNQIPPHNYGQHPHHNNQGFDYPRSRSQQQNYYLDERGYGNPQEIGRHANHSPYQTPQRPYSAYPQPSSFNSVSLHNSGRASVALYGWQSVNTPAPPRSATVVNEVNRIMDIIRILVGADGSCDISKITRALTSAGAANHPRNIRGLGITTWSEFVAEFFRDVYVYHESAEGNFIVDPKQLEFIE